MVEHDDEQNGAHSEAVDKLSAPKTAIIHEVVRRQGEEELARPDGSLFWSGIAGGVTIMASVIAEGAIMQVLPETVPWREMAADIGYSLGFVLVILGRMQLFTEQTIVTVLPVMAAPSGAKLLATARLWAIVLAGNLLGTCAAAAMNVLLHLTGPDLTHAMLSVSAKLLTKPPLALLEQAVPAGFLIAAVAWLRAGVTSGELWIIVALTSAIALGGFAHVIASSAEAFLLVFAGHTGFGHAVGGIILPALAGNIIGGTGLFALLAYAQVSREI